ncbi:hypothetical protein CK203_112856 [Vitis vinifera]|uniref:Uncharacterized protein n=1 Tax=Vitis vinifera TaxID=29760 RepID=A0A438CEZ5_VITVI|nr:hypothetical protein CK203_112856 [Vitis vinifera]
MKIRCIFILSLNFRGKYQKEIQTLDYDYHISEEDEYGQSELVNQEAGELDMSGTTLEPSSNDHPETEEVIEEGRDSIIEPSPPSEQFGFEDVFTEIPNQSSSVEGGKAAMKSLQKNKTWELVEVTRKEASWVSLDLYCEMHGVRNVMSEGVQIEEVIVWVEAIPESMVWKETGMSGCQPVDTPIEEGGNLVTWKSKKQNVVARSSAEAEFRGMTLGL